jgi:hypothetical protein
LRLGSIKVNVLLQERTISVYVVSVLGMTNLRLSQIPISWSFYSSLPHRRKLTPTKLCKPDMVYILDQAHGLHFFCVSVMPAFYRDYGFQSFIENPE